MRRGFVDAGRRQVGVRARGVFLPLQLVERLPHDLDVDRFQVAAERREHAGVAQRVGQARDAARVAEDQRERVRREDLAVPGAGHLEAMADVRAHLRLGQRAQVEAQPHALAQLDEVLGVELCVQLGLAREDDAQHLLLGRLDAGEQAHFLEHLVREVLRLVDDQQHLAAVRVLLDQEVVERGEQFGLAHAERAEPELRQQALQEFDRRDLRLVDLRDDDVLVDFLEERFDQRGLARADLARNHDEAVREPDRRLHVRLGAGVDLARIQERRVRAEPEREFLELEVFQVHRCARFPPPTIREPAGPRPRDPSHYPGQPLPRRPGSPLSAGRHLPHDLAHQPVALDRAGRHDRAMADLAARARLLAVVVPVHAGQGQDGIPLRQGADEIDHRAMPHRARVAERQAEDRPQVVLELRGGRAFDGPVPGVVHAWRHLVRDQLALADEELDRQHAGVLEVPQHALQVDLRRLLQDGVTVRRQRHAQDAVLVRVGDDRVSAHFARRAAHADDRYFALEIDEAFENQRHVAERIPGGLEIGGLAQVALALAVVAEPARLEHAGQAERLDGSAQVFERVHGAERRRRNLQFREELLLEQAILRNAQCLDGRPHGMRLRHFLQRGDGNVLEFVGDEVDVSCQPLEAVRIVERTRDDRRDLAAGRIRAGVEKAELLRERIAREGQHASELARTDDADLHVEIVG